MQLRQALRHQVPELSVFGTEYLPSKQRQIAAQVLGYGQLASMGVIFFGDSIMPALGYAQYPAWYEYVRENKMTTFFWILGIWKCCLTATYVDRSLRNHV
eukprot:Rmarinus@m.17792